MFADIVSYRLAKNETLLVKKVKLAFYMTKHSFIHPTLLPLFDDVVYEI